MTSDAASRFPQMGRPFMAVFDRFLRTRSLARSVTLLLAGALALLLLVNASTFVLIRRTTELNAQIDATWQMRRAARTLILTVQKAETSQRGYLLTGQPEFLRNYDKARASMPDVLSTLNQKAVGDEVGQASIEALTRVTRDKFVEMSSILELARAGRIGQAVSQVRTGRGQDLTDQLDLEMASMDRHISDRLDEQRSQSNRSGAFTVSVNAIAGALILVLAGIILMLVRRYLTDIRLARDALDEVNAGLEETVRLRTAALTRANDEVQRFAYIVSHDLRSPLVNVMGYTAELEQAGKTIDAQMTKVETVAPDLIESDALTAVRDDIPEAVGFIRASTEKMDRLINAILKLSRDGRRSLTPETLDMTAMARAIADGMRHQIDEQGAEIVVETLPSFENDRLSIDQVMGNLIDNAIKYLDPARPGRIVVSGRDKPGGWVEFEVADNGRGVSPRDHERIFELFRRSGRQDRPGEGLGLAFVRNSVRRLGGDVEVESELGEGSTFRVKFPKRLILAEAGDKP